MNEDVILLRYGEIFLKGKNRKFFEQQLVKNVRRAMHGVDGARVERLYMRTQVAIPEDARGRALERLGRVFGVTSLSPARVVAKEYAAISDEAVRQTRMELERRGAKAS